MDTGRDRRTASALSRPRPDVVRRPFRPVVQLSVRDCTPARTEDQTNLDRVRNGIPAATLRQDVDRRYRTSPEPHRRAGLSAGLRGRPRSDVSRERQRLRAVRCGETPPRMVRQRNLSGLRSEQAHGRKNPPAAGSAEQPRVRALPPTLRSTDSRAVSQGRREVSRRDSVARVPAILRRSRVAGGTAAAIGANPHRAVGARAQDAAGTVRGARSAVAAEKIPGRRQAVENRNLFG